MMEVRLKVLLLSGRPMMPVPQSINLTTSTEMIIGSWSSRWTALKRRTGGSSSRVTKMRVSDGSRISGKEVVEVPDLPPSLPTTMSASVAPSMFLNGEKAAVLSLVFKVELENFVIKHEFG